MPIFKYSAAQIKYLSDCDPKLGTAMKAIGRLRREGFDGAFAGLVGAIAAQQISSKAAETVWKKLVAQFGEVSVKNMCAAKSEDLRACGMSMRKAEYILNAVRAGESGEVDFDNLNELADEEVFEKLIKLKGVGEWTVEMVMIFSMNRMNVLSRNDYGIKMGMRKLYGEEITKEFFEKKRALYSPYGSVASLYLWEIAAKNEDL